MGRRTVERSDEARTKRPGRKPGLSYSKSGKGIARFSKGYHEYPSQYRTAGNGAIARALRKRHPDWTNTTIHGERTRVLEGETGKQPDILIDAPRRQPVIIESEFDPARNVENEAVGRLGSRVARTGGEVESVVSVVLPTQLQTADLELAVEESTYKYATHQLNIDGESVRWPQTGWLEGGVDELADAIEYISLSERQLARGTAALELVVNNAAGLLSEHAGEGPLCDIAAQLYQEPGSQTERMAAAICVSAFVFHAAIEGQENIPPVPLSGSIDKGSLLQTWNEILEVNYWPIFSIARDVLAVLPIRSVPIVMDRIANSISVLSSLGATTYHDMTGRMFQTLITDRKFLATFYTLPESACLLAEVAVDRLDIEWSDRNSIERLKIADFACGTGALLAAAQRAVYRRYRRSGGDDADLHQVIMENVMMGLDIMPAATHLTCSMLSSAHPSLAYGGSQIHTMPYGMEGRLVHIGSLDLLGSAISYALFATGETMSSTLSASKLQNTVTVNDQSCDLVIMNPPFTRPTNHEASHAEIPVPSFAGFNTSLDEQKAMAEKLKRSARICGHGNAGIASNFMDLAHYKLKHGGVLALVLPFTFLRGKSWEKARQTLSENYKDIHVVSIATVGLTASAFSADTGMAECLVIATKKSDGNSQTMFTNLAARPSSLLEASELSKHLTPRAIHGDILDAGVAGIRSPSVIETAQSMPAGRLVLPRQEQTINIPVVELGMVAVRGLVSRDIDGPSPVGHDSTPARGPFLVRPIQDGEFPTYPMLWAHSAERERKPVVLPDSCGDPRPGDESRAAEVWNRTASLLHANLDFRINSQSLVMCITPELSLGGTAWPNISPSEKRYEIPLLLWCNSTLGMIMHWWKGTRQQMGRSRMRITTITDLPVIDPRALNDIQLENLQGIFVDLKDSPFLPANEAYRDEARKELDRRILFGTESVLGLDSSLEEGLNVLRDQWCAEPSVHGGKSTRIQL